MTTDDKTRLLTLSHDLLQSIDTKDWETYARLCHPDLTAYEPETAGHLIEGMPFHKFYFDLPRSGRARLSSISSPKVQLFGDSAVVTYIRLVQATDLDGAPSEAAYSETRVWVRFGDDWRHVHFHRSPA